MWAPRLAARRASRRWAPAWPTPSWWSASPAAACYCVQWTLMWLGYYHGLVTGMYDQATFRRGHRLPAGQPAAHASTATPACRPLIAMGIYSGRRQGAAAAVPRRRAGRPRRPGPVHRVRAADRSQTHGPVQRHGRRHLRQGHPGRREELPARQPAADRPTASPTRRRSPRSASGAASPPRQRHRPVQRRRLVAVAVPGRAQLPGRATASPCTATTASAAKENADIIAREFAKDGADVAHPAVLHLHRVPRGRLRLHGGEHQPGHHGRQPLHVPAERVVGHVRAQRPSSAAAAGAWTT